MTPAQQGVWVVQCALYRGRRHAQKQQLRRRIGQIVNRMKARIQRWEDYCARREARGME